MMSAEEQREMDRLKAVNEGLNRIINKKNAEISLLYAVVKPMQKAQTYLLDKNAEGVDWKFSHSDFDLIWSALEAVRESGIE